MLLDMELEKLMLKALEVAEQAGDEVPVGAVLYSASGERMSSASNRREQDADVTGHAEIIALRQAGKSTADWRLDGATLVVTLEPCAMCASAIREARVARVIFGAFDEKAGAAGSVYDILRDSRLGFVPEVIGGVLADECSKSLSDFFESKRLG